MGRSVQVEATVQSYAEDCVQSRAAAEVGTLVGRFAAGKDLLLQALRAPERDGAPPISVTAAGAAAGGSKKGSKPGKPQAGASLELDDEWVVEHAAMVERLLPGGLDVVGFYVLCSSDAFTGAAGVLAALAHQAARELSGRLPSLLLLHMDTVSGSLTLREAPPAGGTLKPCELKVVDGLLDQMQQLHARVPLDVQLPVSNNKQELQAAFQAVTDAEERRVQGGLGLVAGQLASADRQLADVVQGGAAVVVELLLPPACSLGLSTAGGGKTGSGLQRGRAEDSSLGIVGLQGVLDCRACVHRRESAVAAVQAVESDVRRTLAARLDALLDAAEQQQEAAAAEQRQQQQQASGGGGGGSAAAPPPLPPVHPFFAPVGSASKPVTVSLPRRAFVAASCAGGVPYCDYLFEGESSQAMLGRLQMLLPFPELPTAAVECLEQAAARAAGGAAASRKPVRSTSGNNSRAAALPCTAVAAGSIAVAALALLLGYMSLGS